MTIISNEERLLQLADAREMLLRDIQDHVAVHGLHALPANPPDHNCARCLALYMRLFEIRLEELEIEEQWSQPSLSA